MTSANVVRKVGLARALSKLGYCSRSIAGDLIRAGRVSLNGRVRRDVETPVDLHKDKVAVDGLALEPQAKIYLMLNKPRGMVTTASDEKGRETVYACLGRDHPFVAPVGRLDKASEGLLLLTNDSEWSARVLAPETHLAKTYHVQIAAVCSEDLLRLLGDGVVSDGELLRVKKASFLRGGALNSWLEVVLEEGKNRHIRRMLAHCGIEVLRLLRVAVGPLVLGSLPKKIFRNLTAAEKQAMDRAMKLPTPNL